MRAGRIGVVAVVVVAAVVAMVAVAVGQDTEVERVASEVGYEQVTVTFTGPVTDGDGNDLGTGNFDLVGTTVGISGVTGADDTWTVEFDGAVAPNLTELAFSDIWADGTHDEDDGQALTLEPVTIPIATAELEALLDGFADTALPLGDLGEIPFAGEWFANRQLRSVDVGEEIDEARVAIARQLTDFLDVDIDADGVRDEVDELTQEAIEDWFDEEIDGLGIDFGERTATLEFTEDFAHEDTLQIDVEVEQVPILLRGDLELDFGLRNDLTLDLDDDGEARLSADTDLAASASVVADDEDFAARVGFVDIAADGVDIDLDAEASLGLACAEPEGADFEADPDDPDLGLLCAEGEEVTSDVAFGDDEFAEFSVGEIEVVAFEQDFSFDADDFDAEHLLSVAWNDLADDLPDPPDDELGSPEIEAGPFEEVGLHHFGNADVSAVTLGLEWVGAWLEAVSDHEELGEDLPLVDSAPGEVAELASLALDRIGDLEARVRTFIEDHEHGDRPSAQDVAELLCELDLAPTDELGGDCDDLSDADIRDLLDIVTEEVNGTDEIQRLVFPVEYDLAFDFDDLEEFIDEEEDDEEGFNLEVDFGLADAIDGLSPEQVPSFELRASAGEWTDTDPNVGSRVSATVSFELGIDIRESDLLEDEWFTDYDPGDTERFSGGVPYRFTPSHEDMCNAFVRLLRDEGDIDDGLSRSVLALENGWGSNDASVAEDCAEALLDGISIDLPDDDDTTIGDYAADDSDVCEAAARVWNIDTDDLKNLNGFGSDSECADQARDVVAAQDAEPHLQYLAERPDALQIGHRLFLAEGEGDLVDLDLRLEGRGVEAGLRAGILDLGVTGAAPDGEPDILVNPGLTVGLAGDDFDRNADVVDLVELGQRADAGELGGVLGDIDVSGVFEGRFDFHNSIVEDDPGVGDIGLDVRGDLAGFLDDADNGDTVEVLQRRLDFADDELGEGDVLLVGIELGDWRSLQDLTAAEVLDMLVGILEQVAEAADEDDLAFEIPFIGTNLQDITGFARSTAEVADGIADRDPRTLTGFERALRRGLEEAGWPDDITDTVEVALTGDGDALTFGFDLDETVEGRYPLSINLGDWLEGAGVSGIPVDIAPFDGGARLTAEATAAWSPTIGVQFDGDSVAERVYLEGAPELSADFDADLDGDAFIGPMTVNVHGDASADPSIGLDLDALGGSGGQVTLADFELPSDPLDAVVIGGDFDANLDVGPTPAGNVTVQTTTFDALFRDGPGVVDVSTTVNFTEITLDLRTLVQGTAQTARFVGRTMQGSDRLTEGLPMIGDELNRIADVGGDLRAFADAVEDLWDDAEGNSDAFLDELNDNLDEVTCQQLGVEDCEVTIDLLDETGDSITDEDVSVGQAHALRLALVLADEVSGEQSLAGGLGGDALALNMDGSLDYTAGYRAGIAFDISIEDGFLVRAVDEDGEVSDTLLELYASADTNGVDAGVDIAGIQIAGIVDGTVSIGGPNGDGLGPDGDAAGFALTLAEPIGLGGLADRDRDPERILQPQVMLDADMRLPIHIAEGAGVVPTLIAPVIFEWEIDETVGDDFAIDTPLLMIGEEGDPVRVDASELIDGVLAPILARVDDYNPVDFGPVNDALEREIELLEASVRDILEGVPVTPEIEQARTLFLFLLDLDAIATRIVEGSFDGQYNFGHVTVLSPDEEIDTPVLQSAGDDGGDIQEVLDAFANLANLLPGTTGGGDGSAQALGQDSIHPMTGSGSSGLMPDMGPLELPILDDPLSALGMLVGSTDSADVSFLEVDLDPYTLGYGIGFEQELFSIDFAFLEGHLEVGLDGRLGLTMRLGFGYDARGITSGHPINGFYIVDPHDANTGRQQQVIEVGASLSAYVDGKFGIDVAGISVASAEFHGSGGAGATAGLQLFTDSPAIPPERRGDGKFHLDDINRVRVAHTLLGEPDGSGALVDFFCMFRPGVELFAQLAFEGKAKALGATVWSTDWESDWPPLEFRTSCRINPQPAQLLDGDLILNAGPDFSGDRFDENPDADNERFVVDMDGGDIVVTWEGDAGPTGLQFQEMTFDPEQVQSLEVELDAGNLGEVIIEDFPSDIPVRLDGGDAKESRFEIYADVDATIRSADVVEVHDGRNDIRTASGGEVTIAGGENWIDGRAGTTYHFVGDDWGVNDLSHRSDDAVLDFSGSANPVEGTWAFGTIEVVAQNGGGLLEVFDGSTVARAVGSDNDGDVFDISGDLPEDFTVNAGEGEDNEIFVDADGNTERNIIVEGNPDGEETVTVEGSFARNEIVLRARPGDDPSLDDLDVTEVDLDDIDPAQFGFVAFTNPLRGDDSPIDRVNYDLDVERLIVDGNAGQNQFVLDDVATDTEIRGGDGDGEGGGNDFQVGQVFGTADDPEYRIGDNVVDDGEVRTRNVEGRGPMTLGVSHPTTIEGGDGDDRFTVYSSAAPQREPAEPGEDPEAGLQLEGVSGNNTFLLRAFIIEGGVGATGGDGDDYFEYVEDYVQNGEMSIDGGTGGFNTMIAVGTELGDGFVLDDDELFICRIPRSDLGDDDHPGGVDPDDEWASIHAPEPFVRDELPYPEEDEDCAWEVEYANIDMVVGHGLGGDNVFWVRSVLEETRTKLFGGEDGSDFYVGELGLLEGTGDPADADSEDLGGDVSSVDGRVVVHGEGLPQFDVSVRDPWVLPTEDDTPTSEPDFDTEFARENTLLVDARLQGDGEVGFLDSAQIAGLGMPETASVPVPPDGDDNPFTGDPDEFDRETDPDEGEGGDNDGDENGGAGSDTASTADEQEMGDLPGGVIYGGMDEVAVLLGGGSDDFTIHSTATFTRELDTEDGEEPDGEEPETQEPDTEHIETETLLDVGGGNDEAVVNTIAGPTEIQSTEGSNVVRVGSAVSDDAAERVDSPDRASTLEAIVDELDIVGEDGSTDVFLDASGSDVADDGLGDVLDVAQGQVRGLSMPGQVAHSGLGLLDIALTDGEDITNVRGTSADQTVLHGLGADDRFFVSDDADLGVDEDWELREAGDPPVERDDDPSAATPPYLSGELVDIAGDVDVEAGTGDNLLMVSDRDGTEEITGATLDADVLSGFAGGDIGYDTDSDGTFIRGVTVWTRGDDVGDADAAGDEVTVAGTRRDGDPTTLDWEDRDEGLRTVTTLNTGAGQEDITLDLDADEDGFFVLNTGPGDDVVDGSASSLGLVIFGGDGDDDIATGSGDDIVFGDHGRVEYHDGDTVSTQLGDADDASVNDGVAQRPDRMYSLDAWEPDRDPGGAFNNEIDVGDGDDIAWGGLGNARVGASDGRNALLGDHGEVRRRAVSDVDGPTHVVSQDGFIDIVVNEDETFFYEVELLDEDEAGGGDDAITGGFGNDVIYGGPGDDVIVGSPGDGSEDRDGGDVIFAGDGDDVVWGGPGDDRIYGGHGDNVVNVKRPTFDSDDFTQHNYHDEAWWDRAWGVAPTVDADPAPDRTNDDNLVYGGRGRDAIQADSGGPGRQDGDRLMNFYGPYNLFLVCEGAYGAGWILRQPSPGMLDTLTELAVADGAFEADEEGSSGWRQLALVTQEHAADNRNPPHPDHPGNNAFCGEGAEG